MHLKLQMFCFRAYSDIATESHRHNTETLLLEETLIQLTLWRGLNCSLICGLVDSDVYLGLTYTPFYIRSSKCE